jgi:hypothetical protein
MHGKIAQLLAMAIAFSQMSMDSVFTDLPKHIPDQIEKIMKPIHKKKFKRWKGAVKRHTKR